MTARPSWWSDFLPQVGLGMGCESLVVCPWCEAEQDCYVMDIRAEASDFSCKACEREFTVKFIGGEDECVATGKRSHADVTYLDWYAARHGQAGAP